MTGFRFEVTIPGGPPMLVTELVELDGIPSIGHQLRVSWRGVGLRDMFISQIVWFHSPSNLSHSGLLVLSETPP